MLKQDEEWSLVKTVPVGICILCVLSFIRASFGDIFTLGAFKPYFIEVWYYLKGILFGLGILFLIAHFFTPYRKH